MLRLAQPRQALRLQWVSCARSYSTPTVTDEADAPSPSERSRKRTQRPVRLAQSGAYEPPLTAPVEGSFTSELLQNTKSGQTATEYINTVAASLAAKRRAARLAREAEQTALGADAPVQLPRRDRTPRTFTPNVNFDQLNAGGLQRQGGDQRGPRGPRLTGDRPQGDRRASGPRPQGDRRGPRDGNRSPFGQSRKPPPRVLTQNRPPSSIQAAEASISDAEAAELTVALDAPNQPGPMPISPNLGNVFPKVQHQLRIGKANPYVPSPATILRNAGDYSAFVPTPTKDLYTTPVRELPVLTQLALAAAQNKHMDINQRKVLAQTVAKAVGEIRAQA